MVIKCYHYVVSFPVSRECFSLTWNNNFKFCWSINSKNIVVHMSTVIHLLNFSYPPITDTLCFQGQFQLWISESFSNARLLMIWMRDSYCSSCLGRSMLTADIRHWKEIIDITIMKDIISWPWSYFECS